MCGVYRCPCKRCHLQYDTMRYISVCYRAQWRVVTARQKTNKYIYRETKTAYSSRYMWYVNHIYRNPQNPLNTTCRINSTYPICLNVRVSYRCLSLFIKHKHFSCCDTKCYTQNEYRMTRGRTAETTQRWTNSNQQPVQSICRDWKQLPSTSIDNVCDVVRARAHNSDV